VHRSTQALRADIDVHDHALRFVGQARVAVCHAEGDHLVRAGDNLGKGALLFILAFDYGFDYRGVVGAQVHCRGSMLA